MPIAVLPMALASLGTLSAAAAVAHERLMHRHRQPGVGYWQATLRRDGGWRQRALFTDDGLAHQGRAARYGLLAVMLWVAALLTLIALQ
jgi:hypothetical protein